MCVSALSVSLCLTSLLLQTTSNKSMTKTSVATVILYSGYAFVVIQDKVYQFYEDEKANQLHNRLNAQLLIDGARVVDFDNVFKNIVTYQRYIVNERACIQIDDTMYQLKWEYVIEGAAARARARGRGRGRGAASGGIFSICCGIRDRSGNKTGTPPGRRSDLLITERYHQ